MVLSSSSQLLSPSSRRPSPPLWSLLPHLCPVWHVSLAAHHHLPETILLLVSHVCSQRYLYHSHPHFSFCPDVRHHYLLRFHHSFWLVWNILENSDDKLISPMQIDADDLVSDISRWSPAMIIINTLRQRQIGCHFPDIFKCIFLNGNVWISHKISLKYVPKGLIKNIPVLIRCQGGASKTLMTS